MLLGLEVEGDFVGGSGDSNNLAQVRHTFNFQVFQDDWTFINLFSTSVITSEYVITDEAGKLVGKDKAFISVMNKEQDVVLVVNKAGKLTSKTFGINNYR